MDNDDQSSTISASVETIGTGVEQSSVLNDTQNNKNMINQIHENDDVQQLLKTENKSAGILKPDIVFFGEGLPEIYHKSISEDKLKCDLLIVIGSSLKVKPVANIPRN